MYNISIKSTNRKFTQQEAETIMNEICSQTTFSLNGSFVYENNKTRIPLKCDVCGNEWSPVFDSIKRGKGCSKCSYKKIASDRRRSQEDVEKDLNNILQGRYTYKPFVYENKYQRITLYCEKHNHTWENGIENVLNGQRCKFCAKEETFGETLKTEEKSKERRDFRNSIPINENLVRFNMMGYKLGKYEFKGLINTLKLDYVIKTKNFTPIKPYWYKNKDVRIKLKCGIDGYEWETSLGEVIRGSGCKKCGRISGVKERMRKKEDILKDLDKLSEGRYVYDRDFEYKGMHGTDKISCRCMLCGRDFETSLMGLLEGCGCSVCSYKIMGENKKLSKEEVIKRLEEASQGKYTWEDFDYFYITQKIKLQCLKNSEHKWEASISALTFKSNPSGCPHCNPKYSKIETKIREYVESIVEPYGLEVEANKRSIIPSLKDPRFFMEIDIYIPALKLGFEFNSEFYHKEERAIKQGFKSTEHKWQYKVEECEKQGVKLIHISQKSYRSVSEMKKNMALIKDEIMSCMTNVF